MSVFKLMFLYSHYFSIQNIILCRRSGAKPVDGRDTSSALEIQAAICAIIMAQCNSISKLCIRTDSRFLLNAMQKWKRNGWRLADGGADENHDDLQQFYSALNRFPGSLKWEEEIDTRSGDYNNAAADR